NPKLQLPKKLSCKGVEWCPLSSADKRGGGGKAVGGWAGDRGRYNTQGNRRRPNAIFISSSRICTSTFLLPAVGRKLCAAAAKLCGDGAKLCGDFVFVACHNLGSGMSDDCTRHALFLAPCQLRPDRRVAD